MIGNIFLQWFFFFLVSLVALPKTYFFFRRFPDIGYPMSKVLGWSFLGYFIWLFGSFHILSYSMFSIIFTAVLLVILPPCSPIEMFFKPFKQTIFHSIIVKVRKSWKTIVVYEVVFFGLLLIFALMRSYRPEIHGAEKMMDFAFLNIIVKTSYFPPPDPWYAGGFINYYYFGYFLCTLPIKIFGLFTPIGYNLSIASIASLTLLLSFSIGYRLTHRLFLSGLGALTVAVLGNFDGVSEEDDYHYLVGFDYIS